MKKLLTLVLYFHVALNTLAQFRFVENKGQWDSQVRYRLTIPAGYVFVTNKGLQYSFFNPSQVAKMHPSDNQATGTEKNSIAPDTQNNPLIDCYSYQMNFMDANSNPTYKTIKPYPFQENFFIGDSQNWATDVSGFEEIIIENIYPSTDMRLYQSNGNFKYEFIVKTGASPDNIRLQYNFVQNIYLEDKNLLIETPFSTIKEKRPIAYQDLKKGRKDILVDFALNQNVLSFHLPKDFDHDFPLVIDPELIFSTYSGSYSDNWGFTAANDAFGNLYSGSIVFGTRFPVTTGSFQVSFQGEIDVGIHVYNTGGSNLIYATYLGGFYADVPHSLVLSPQNELIIYGSTSSTNFPTTATAIDRTFNNDVSVIRNLEALGGISYTYGSDIFVTKLNSTGNTLLASTYLGGSKDDGLNLSNKVLIKNYGDVFKGDVAVDSDGNIYIASVTNSTNFPVSNATQLSLLGDQDGLVIKMNANLSAISWATYYGGSNIEACFSVKINSRKEVLVAGFTTSSNLSLGSNGFNTAFFGNDDGFVALFAENGAFIRANYLGTSNADHAFFAEIDNDGSVYCLGQTLGQYPVSSSVYSNPNSKQFIHKMSGDLTTSIFSTVIGAGRSTPDIVPTAFLVNECGSIFVAGWGGRINDNGIVKNVYTSSQLPVTTDAIKATTTGDDLYFIILSKDAQRLLYGSFFGSDGGRGEHIDGGTCRFDKRGVIYHVVCACSASGFSGTSDFPTTTLAYSKVNNSFNCNSAAFKFDTEILQPNFDVLNASTNQVVFQGCASFNAIFKYTGTKATSLKWEVLGSSTVLTQNPANFTFSQPGTYTIKLTAISESSCTRELSISKDFFVLGNSVQASVSKSPICLGQSTQLTAFGANAVKYEWNPGTGLNNVNFSNPIAAPRKTTTYTVKMTDINGCVAQNTTKVEVLDSIVADFSIGQKGKCNELMSITLENKSKNANRYVWKVSNGMMVQDEKPAPIQVELPGEYEIMLTAYNDLCQETISKKIVIENNNTPAPNVITPNNDGKNDLLVFPNRENYKLIIVNRWGKTVFQADRYQNDWGSEATPGTYYYQLISPAGIECNDWIEVIR